MTTIAFESALLAIAASHMNAAAPISLVAYSRIPRPPIGSVTLPTCTHTKIPNSVRVVGMRFNGGSAVSTVSVAGLEEGTTHGKIEVAAGSEPIYLVLTSSNPMIFTLTGATNRLRGVLVLHSKGGGVIGVPRSRVQFQKCLTLFSYGVPLAKAAETLSTIVGRQPDVTGEIYQLHRGWISERGFAHQLALRPRYRRGMTPLQQGALSFYPGGVASINARTIVSERPAIPYSVLPSTAGAAQLEEAGAIERVTSDEARFVLEAAKRKYGPRNYRRLMFNDAYYVSRPIQLPTGLCGGHLLTFIVPDRSYVTGDPCHSTILATDGSVVAAPFSM